jgi:hypothetical protein
MCIKVIKFNRSVPQHVNSSSVCRGHSHFIMNKQPLAYLNHFHSRTFWSYHICKYECWAVLCITGSPALLAHPVRVYCTIIDFSDIIHRPVFIQKNVSETGMCLRPQVKRLLSWVQLIKLVPTSGLILLSFPYYYSYLPSPMTPSHIVPYQFDPSAISGTENIFLCILSPPT